MPESIAECGIDESNKNISLGKFNLSWFIFPNYAIIGNPKLETSSKII